ncbi:phosphohistidine phosphatase SixA [Rodentibacter caecimuris]|uniref:Phosphohistidine phosphatase SixA n=1 Tax=Rodentibacter caecimuris TaxID=1796644 RepID=A0ABX3KXI4_9PAST|nr:phosphohistidine phosphatase SixA [Rodentibacter heylii]
MKIFVMRHGEAEIAAATDQLRALNDVGKKQANQQGKWLKNQLESNELSLEKIIVSPYIRAQQTFECLNLAFEEKLVKEDWKGITPYGSPNNVLNYLAVLAEQGIKCVLLISHLPLVGEIVAELYGKSNPIAFYPATIAQLDWNGEKGKIEAYQYAKEVL